MKLIEQATKKTLWLLLIIFGSFFAACGDAANPTPLGAGAANSVADPEAYPIVEPSSTPEPYPGTLSPPPTRTAMAETTTITATPTITAEPSATGRATAGGESHEDEILYLPLLQSARGSATAQVAQIQATATAPARVTPTPTATPTLDFAALREELNAQGQELAFSKIGFHVTFLEEKGMLDEWMRSLDAAGVPFFLKTVDNAEPLYKAQQLREESGVPHTLVFRASGGVPNYDLPPAQAAHEHWEFHREKFPPELDPQQVWLETINEVDKNRADWLAQFALETARLAMADGFRWAAFGWATGEPEIEDWQSPAMLEFLRLAGANPDRLAIAVHEYSLTRDEIKNNYPYQVGRFLDLFRVADQHGIPRPTVLISEWGWEYETVPPVGQAMADIRWAASLYAHFPQVKGAAIWNLGSGCCFGDVSQEVSRLIEPLLHFNLGTYFEIPQASQRASTNAERYR